MNSINEDSLAAPNGLPVVYISEDTWRHTIVAEGTRDRYEGHPTTLLSDDGKTLFAVWTTGHGGPCGQMARSDDGGKNWLRLDNILPRSYSETNANCPTLQKAKAPDGHTRYLVYSCKLKTETINGATKKEPDGLGILCSDDLGITWYEPPNQPHISARMPPTGFMRLKNGSYALFGQRFKDSDKALDRPADDQEIWMAISNDGGLTYGEARSVARAENKNLCEPCCLRSPDGKSLVLIMRENRHSGNSMMCFSDDEGETWSQPVDTPWGLTGDRHEGILLPDGRYLIAFRDMAPKSNTSGQFVAWVGTFDDLRSGRPGQYRIHLLFHHGIVGRWPGNPWDCGYSGVELLPDETIVCTTYILYFHDDRKSSVVSTRFKISETDDAASSLLS